MSNVYYKVTDPTNEQLNNSIQGLTAKKSLDGNTYLLTPMNKQSESLFWGEDEYSNGQEILLFNHKDFRTYLSFDGQIEQSPYYKIYLHLDRNLIDTYTNYKTPPFTLDYKKQLRRSLHVHYQFNNGFMYKATYYEKQSITEDPQTLVKSFIYESPVLEVDVDYVVGSDGYVINRTTTRKWFFLDDRIDDDNVKITTKYYDTIMAIREAKRRRDNIVNNLTKDILGLLVMFESTVTNVNEAAKVGVAFVRALSKEINEFINFGNQEDSMGNTSGLIEIIQGTSLDGDFPWLNHVIDQNGTTIKMYILAQITRTAN